MQIGRRLAAAALLAAALPLSACSSGAGAEARVLVRVAPSAHPEDYDVHVAGADAEFRSSFRLRSGESRALDVPAGWITVRVAGLCVVPTPVSGTTTVEVRPDRCRLLGPAQRRSSSAASLSSGAVGTTTTGRY